MSDNFIKFISWDSIALGMDTYEIQTLKPELLEQALQRPGHYTIKVDPLSSKKILHDYDFYYCDTLIEPHCSQKNFIFFKNEMITITRSAPLDELIEICTNVFPYGRFHRDFNVDISLAEIRYINWLKELYAMGSVYALYDNNHLAGLHAIVENKIVLTALTQKYRGQGMAKYLWSTLCEELFNQGHKEITISISAANLAVANLCASLGFRYKSVVDVYHKVVR